ncbi:shikimate kinase [Geopsychrobacter electrodiphilus]|uniref:shikimate kinase n=1 Tax=Geopsychrobacter electrodiphilus TaxID=225196 RepID=UPI000380B5B9|nr:shikimate kinase [Geopsychrobacter electrodiphilus]
MPKTNIILTGFMGTGKSTLGRLLAQELDYRFVDTDQLLEAELGQTIADFFAQAGEVAFRKKEEELVLALTHQRKLVIATGGGLILNPVNAKALAQTGQIFCLTATAEEILERISNQQHIRPLLQDQNPLAKIHQLLEQRAASYQQFTQISTSGRTQKDLIAELLQQFTRTA